MSARDQLINDIKLLPEHTIQVIGIIVKDIIAVNAEIKPKPRPVFGSGKGQMRIADDFDAPLEESKKYME